MKRLMLVVMLLFIGWDGAWWLLGVKPLFPWQLEARRRSGTPGLLLLDVRSPQEFRWFHLAGARNLPGVLADRAQLAGIPPDRPLVIICLTGHRSAIVAYILKKRGFTRVSHLTWGMVGWQVYKFFRLGPKQVEK